MAIAMAKKRVVDHIKRGGQRRVGDKGIGHEDDRSGRHIPGSGLALAEADDQLADAGGQEHVEGAVQQRNSSATS